MSANIFPPAALRIHFDRIPQSIQFVKNLGPTPLNAASREAEIVELLKNYERVFSPIAKSNFSPFLRETLLKLQKKTGEWLAANPRDRAAYPAMTALKEIVDSTLRSVPVPTLSPYNLIICIGHPVGTGGFEVMNPNNPQSPWKVQYKSTASDSVDMIRRTTELQQVIRKAYELYQAQKLTTKQRVESLKIFMAPEFYFRGSKGAYPMDVVSEILPRMRTVTSGREYQDWLFVFGTAIAATEIKPGEMMLDNFALVQKGGESGAENSYVILKELISHVDFRRPGWLVDGWNLYDNNTGNRISNWNTDRRVEVRGSVQKAIPSEGSKDINTVAHSKHTDERMGGSVFTMDGIRFGLEVCKDHLEGRLKPKMVEYKIQVQLIPSAGATIVPGNCVGKVAFNVDGTMKQAQLKVGTGPVTIKKGHLVIFDPVQI